jgi:hypothetical protein
VYWIVAASRLGYASNSKADDVSSVLPFVPGFSLSATDEPTREDSRPTWLSSFVSLLFNSLGRNDEQRSNEGTKFRAEDAGLPTDCRVVVAKERIDHKGGNLPPRFTICDLRFTYHFLSVPSVVKMKVSSLCVLCVLCGKKNPQPFA